MPKFSVIVPTYDGNSDELLLRCLRSIRGYSRAELIVVDEGQKERPQQVHGLATKYESVDHTGIVDWVRRVNLSREMGYELATGDFIVICDSDVVPSPNWEQEFSDILALDGVGMVGPRITPICHQFTQWIKPHPSWSERFVDVESMKRLSPELWKVEELPDTYDVRKGYPLESINGWTYLNDCFVGFTRECLSLIRPVKDYGQSLRSLPGHAAVVSNRVAVWHSKELSQPKKIDRSFLKSISSEQTSSMKLDDDWVAWCENCNSTKVFKSAVLSSCWSEAHAKSCGWWNKS